MDENLRAQQLAALKRKKELREELAKLVSENVMLELKIKQETAYVKKPKKEKFVDEVLAERDEKEAKIKKPLSGAKTVLLCIGLYFACAVIGIYVSEFCLDTLVNTLGLNTVLTAENIDIVRDLFKLLPTFGIPAIPLGIIIKVRSNKKCALRKNKLQEKYSNLIIEAQNKDYEAYEQYKKDVKAAEKSVKEKYQPEIDANQQLMKPITAEQESINVLSKRDEEHLDEIIELIESYRADNVKEALAIIDERQRHIEEERRRKEEERRRQEEERNRREAEIRRQEEARRATMPGRVNVIVGSVNTRSGALQNVRNSVYIDGQLYGSATSFGTIFQLNPGPHTIYAQMQEAGYIFTSPSRSFNLPGDGSVEVKIKIDYGNVYVTVV